MVQVISFDNRERHLAVVNSMYEDRKRVFVDQLKWDVPVVDGRYEIDQFDTPDAIYLIASDRRDNRHIGSVRVLPTTKPHVLGDIFPQLCEGGVMIGEDVWEISRLCYAPHLDKQANMAVRRDLGVAMIEFGLLYGISTFTGVAHMQWLSQILASGMDVAPLGVPQQIGAQMVGAIRINVTPATLNFIRSRTGARFPILELEARQAA
jgi:acyl-homoserine lactone synthase